MWRLKRQVNTMSPQEKITLCTKRQIGLVRKTCSWGTVEVKGLENVPKDKPVLVVSNHQSNMDIPVY